MGAEWKQGLLLPVDVVHEIYQDDDRHNEEVDFLLQLLLDHAFCGGELPQMVKIQTSFLSRAGYMPMVLCQWAIFNFVFHVQVRAECIRIVHWIQEWEGISV